MPDVRVGVVGATGAVGTVTLELLADRGFERVRALASVRSAGRKIAYGDRQLCGEQLVKLAHQAGAPDNVTVVVSDVTLVA